MGHRTEGFQARLRLLARVVLGGGGTEWKVDFQKVPLRGLIRL